MGKTKRVYSNAPWEKQVGYCRALRRGPHIWITGTAPIMDDGATYAPGDPYAQTARCLALIEKALAELDAGMEHVVRTRLYVTDITRWEAIGRAHAAVFKDFPPTTTMIQVAGLIAPDMMVEIEADACVD
ncbi:MAG: RidA family protein [Robiginitomaculum sp.]|nr:RidA family protein [Robiginitomaculum sp.]MDQ7077401.1 RidA family protein [Robiginitomaculum sp.]